ncbi:META domain-containing protein [Paenochrobactrum pullorum]|uniref:META domain-containing protein n=1 Tax=Paenochrobactrum pullorum TaxID=1324351 RepID=UPI0035BBD5E4
MQSSFKKNFAVTAAIIMGLVVTGAATMVFTTSMPSVSIAAEKTIKGNVIYLERIALPPEAKLIVELADVSLADAPAKIIGDVTIDSISGPPIPYSIDYDSSKLEANHTYALQARISAGDTLWFVNDTRHSFDPEKLQSQYDIQVVMVGRSEASDQATGLFGKEWLAEDLQNAGVIDNAQTTLTVQEDGSVNGSGSCNRYFGSVEISEDKLSFGQMGSTFMMCPPALMDQERKFFDVLANTRRYKIEMGKLVLLNEQDEKIAILAPNM